MQPLKKPTILAGFLVPALIIFLIFPVSAAASGTTDCPTCRMIWIDTCIPFEANNETMYNAELEAANDMSAKILPRALPSAHTR